MENFTKDQPYLDHLGRVQVHITQMLNKTDRNKVLLFASNLEGKKGRTKIWDAYINTFPEGEERKTRDCNACRHFLTSWGNLFIIDDAGEAHPLLGVVVDGEKTIEDKAISAAARVVRKAGVGGAVEIRAGSSRYVSVATDDGKNVVFGTKESGGFNHLHFVAPAGKIFMTPSSKVERGYFGDRVQGAKVLVGCLRKYPQKVFDRAVEIFSMSDTFRAELKSGTFLFLAKLKKFTEGMPSDKLYRGALTLVYPRDKSFCAVGSGSAAAVVLDAINDGLSLEQVRAKWKSVAEGYMQSTVAPTESQKKSHREALEDLGLVKSLSRQLLKMDSVKFDWENPFQPEPVDVIEEQKSVDIDPDDPFAAVQTRETPQVVVEESLFEAGKVTMSWTQFLADYLPKATNVEIFIPRNTSQFVALTCPRNPDAKKLLMWENQIGHFYQSGGSFAKDIATRVVEQGGQYENAYARCTIAWPSLNDLDLFTTIGDKARIYYGEKEWRGHKLDVDANARGTMLRKDPVENFVVMDQKRLVPNVPYVFYLRGYDWRDATSGASSDQVDIELKIGDKVWHKTMSYERGWHAMNNSIVLTIGSVTFKENQTLMGSAPSGDGWQVGPLRAKNLWGQEVGKFVPIRGICKSPNLWGEDAYLPAGKQTFFMLNDCKPDDLGGDDASLAFAIDQIVPEARPYRATLAGVARDYPLAIPEGELACGLGYSFFEKQKAQLRVTTASSVTYVEIDKP